MSGHSSAQHFWIFFRAMSPHEKLQPRLIFQLYIEKYTRRKFKTETNLMGGLYISCHSQKKIANRGWKHNFLHGVKVFIFSFLNWSIVRPMNLVIWLPKSFLYKNHRQKYLVKWVGGRGRGGGGIDESHMIPLNAQNRVNGCLRWQIVCIYWDTTLHWNHIHVLILSHYIVFRAF